MSRRPFNNVHIHCALPTLFIRKNGINNYIVGNTPHHIQIGLYRSPSGIRSNIEFFCCLASSWHTNPHVVCVCRQKRGERIAF